MLAFALITSFAEVARIETYKVNLALFRPLRRKLLKGLHYSSQLAHTSSTQLTTIGILHVIVADIV